MSTLFQSQKQEEKIDFFVRCQTLMLKHHPKSSFIITQRTLPKAIESFQESIHRYQGYSHADENICVLWNKILVSDETNVNRVVTENAYQPPNPKFNGVSIDFAVFRKIEDCFMFIQANKQEEMKYVLFIREGRPKLYPLEQILKSLNFNQAE